MSLSDKFTGNIADKNLFSPKDKLLLAVSGGIDSVVLCELCYLAGYDFVIAHCNFQLREAESERDEAFVRGLGSQYGKEVLVQRFDTEQYASEHKLSIQEAARDLRYRWFHQLTDGDGMAKFTLTAHHADDNAETLLMNFCRGTGLHGLTGIPATAAYAHIVRPLLPFRKAELLAFAEERRLDHVEDSSNAGVKYTRNIFRHEVLPAIGKTYPQVTENLLDNISRFRETEKIYRYGITEIKKKLCRQKNGELYIPIKQILGYHNRALWFEIIREYGFTEKQVDEAVKLCSAESGSYLQSPSAPYRIIRHRNWLVIAPLQQENAQLVIIEASDRQVVFGAGRLTVERKEEAHFKLITSADTACLDARYIRFPLLLRPWKQGDYFYPLGMKKKKKLSRFLIDQKLSKTEKEKLWVLEMDKKIVWVAGYRIDERFKITPATKEVLIITLHKTV
jgi:tRNA(Ile)-lysidine synthase